MLKDKTKQSMAHSLLLIHELAYENKSRETYSKHLETSIDIWKSNFMPFEPKNITLGLYFVCLCLLIYLFILVIYFYFVFKSISLQQVRGRKTNS